MPQKTTEQLTGRRPGAPRARTRLLAGSFGHAQMVAIRAGDDRDPGEVLAEMAADLADRTLIVVDADEDLA